VISLVPELIKFLSKQGLNILYLPRYEIDRTYVNMQSNIYIPEKPLNGLDVCYYSDAVLTGAGTFAREAAIMGTPAISFFAGKQLLAVDRDMIEKKMIYYSRNINNLINYLEQNPKVKIENNLNRSKKVQKEVFEILDNIVLRYV
jgi:predicted glycosyltransferase